jgi:hypothetical protein
MNTDEHYKPKHQIAWIEPFAQSVGGARIELFVQFVGGARIEPFAQSVGAFAYYTIII